jgi:hypothetical protein
MIVYLLIGGAVLAWLFYGPGRKILKLPTWRIGAGVGSVVAFAGAAFCILEKKWIGVVVLAILGLWLASTTRFPRQAKPAPAPRQGMGLSEARSILGVGEGATIAEIKAAYSRLIQSVHPDKGGSAGLAAQLNAARDRLLKK